MEQLRFKVRVSCLTFNHAPYIVDAMNGFTMQQTTFPFVCIIIDDASADGEPEIIKDYLEEYFDFGNNVIARSEETKDYVLIIAQHKTNHNCFFAVLLLKYNHYSVKRAKMSYLPKEVLQAEYVAICEGDDYWIHPNKLQMQVDFMEEHTDYVLCHTDFNLSNGKFRNHKVCLKTDDFYFPDSIQKGIQVGTLTSIYRMSTYQGLPHLFIGKGWPMGDYPLWIELSHEGKIKYIPEVTACYRILPFSASHGNLEKELSFLKAVITIRQFYANYYGIELIDGGYSKSYYYGMMKTAFKFSNKKLARNCLSLAKEKQMTSIKMWFYYYSTITVFGWLLRKLR